MKSSVGIFVTQTILTSKVGHVAVSVHIKHLGNQVLCMKTGVY